MPEDSTSPSPEVKTPNRPRTATREEVLEGLAGVWADEHTYWTKRCRRAVDRAIAYLEEPSSERAAERPGIERAAALVDRRIESERRSDPLLAQHLIGLKLQLLSWIDPANDLPDEGEVDL